MLDTMLMVCTAGIFVLLLVILALVVRDLVKE